MTAIIYQKEAYNIQGAIFEVYKEMGSGFLEAVYQECLEIEFREEKFHILHNTPLNLNTKECL